MGNRVGASLLSGNVPKKEAGSTNTSNGSTDDKSVHARCCTTQCGADFEKRNASDEQELEVEVGVQGCPSCDGPAARSRPHRAQRAQGKGGTSPSESVDTVKAPHHCGLDIRRNGGIKAVYESSHVEGHADQKPSEPVHGSGAVVFFAVDGLVGRLLVCLNSGYCFRLAVLRIFTRTTTNSYLATQLIRRAPKSTWTEMRLISTSLTASYSRPRLTSPISKSRLLSPCPMTQPADT